VSRSLAAQFTGEGAVRVAVPELSCAIRFLEEQRTLLFSSGKPVRPWDIRELHNPWSRAAAGSDSWAYLELCESPALLRIVSELIGPDVILFDSELGPYSFAAESPQPEASCDKFLFPVEPPAGITVRIPFDCANGDAARFVFKPLHAREGPAEFAMDPGMAIFHDLRVEYRILHSKVQNMPFEYVIRYFPASSRYVRDPGDPAQHRLMERLPLFNFAKAPLWLVHGVDGANNDFVTGFRQKAGHWIDGLH
jgi:hypothetical protein